METMNTPHNIPGRRPEGNPYRVPDGYFAELRSTLRERVAPQSEAVPRQSLWHRIRGIVGASAAFGCLVLLATVGFYFTGYKAQQREQLAMQEQVGEMLLGYHLYTEDLEELDEYVSGDPAALADEQAGFAEAVTEYLDTYGYSGAELLATLTETETDW